MPVTVNHRRHWKYLISVYFFFSPLLGCLHFLAIQWNELWTKWSWREYQINRVQNKMHILPLLEIGLGHEVQEAAQVVESKAQVAMTWDYSVSQTKIKHMACSNSVSTDHVTSYKSFPNACLPTEDHHDCGMSSIWVEYFVLF
ncbi:uncharacterized protein LOC111381147 isoform X2 [Olea europaea var. sylvestris]|uniref:uncharacterized protein LOC111381147 isoform X2 n=1 Tax=Olea europaea var. sylvestris TaxID=158386 RepID=UPI000C1D4154|nr:uncharacterized protein LOC111381147 isoform X2 [Olea europaea var. sylvestris]